VSAEKRSSKTFAALEVRNFRLFFAGQMISISGTWMQTVAQSWLVLQLTGSSVDLGIAIALQYVPMLLFASYGGLIADRNNKRTILYCTQTAAGLLAFALGALVSTHHVTLMGVYILATLLGVSNLFDNPARQSFVQEMVGREHIANAISLNSVLMNIGRLIGPGIAAVLIAFVGIAQCFYVNAFSYLGVIVALYMMNAEEFSPLKTVSREKGQLRLGLKYAFTTPVLRGVLISVAIVGTFAYNFTVTLPLLAHDSFHQKTASEYGLFLTAMGVGAVLGGLYIARRSRPTPKLIAVVALGFGFSMSLVALSPNALFATLVLIPTGFFSIAFISTSNATLQLNSSQEMRGRVMSLYVTGFLGTTPIGAPLIGWIISLTNPRVGILVGSLLAIATGVWLALSLRNKVTPTLT